MSTALLDGARFDGARFDRGVGATITVLHPRTQADPYAQAAPVRAAQPRLRITRRGRAVLLALVSAPLVIGALLFALNGGGATASLEGSTVPFQYVTVQPGESLWQVAEEIAPYADPRDVIDAIVAFNSLLSADVFAGQQVAIPTQFAQR